ncbi:MAG: cbb3-type cytochrome c oxidase subunit 3 [Hydrogenovibrio sp.]|jgi:cbb3-type cytochrome oxidase subunit 3|uniref:cbb3-type cytochrome c oxidase subunit 3 n=1 Tax=Hydrogenovibrio TaxID=28884 RepID=UPI00037FA6C2|nr:MULTISPECIES: cbb3-type cytochrome c oxidase subunit 3 [Hydrogenovibrio]MDR9498920.1 cbb3-type cytochrome c oxidase subunit 3 [Hydrogenovibrio sp.]
MLDYFKTDWSAMTTSDWVGLIITVAVFFGMLITFWRALRPSKRKELEEEKYKILDDD